MVCHYTLIVFHYTIIVCHYTVDCMPLYCDGMPLECQPFSWVPVKLMVALSPPSKAHQAASQYRWKKEARGVLNPFMRNKTQC